MSDEAAPQTREETVGQQLAAALGEGYLGSRLDRGETTFWIQHGSWVAAARHVREAGFSVLSDLTAVDYPDRNPRFDISIIVLDMENVATLRLKTMVGEEEATPSLVKVWPGANWFEREVFDLFGVKFSGHPSLRRLLLPADYQGHPLRKDYPVTGPPSSVYR